MTAPDAQHPDPERWDVAVAVSDAFLDEVNADRISALLVRVLADEGVEDGAGLSIEIADDELLTELNTRDGITIVLVTHETDIAAHARRLVQFVDGQVTQDAALPRRTGKAHA